jgi:hypothetical protein
MPLPQAPDTIVRMAETTDNRGQAAISTLFLVRFPGRYVGVLFNAPNEAGSKACQAEAVALVSSIQLTPAAPPPPANVPSAGHGSGGGANPGAAMRASVDGNWEQVVPSQIPRRYNPITKQGEYDYAGALNQFRHVMRFSFSPSGDDVRELDAESYNRQPGPGSSEKAGIRWRTELFSFNPVSMGKEWDPGIRIRG